MNPTGCQLLTAALAVGCHASFVWAILRYFRRGAGMSARMKLLSVTGAAGIALHLAGILAAGREDAAQLASAALYGVALAVFWWALRAAGAGRFAIAFAAGGPTRLIRSGPFAYVRHPIYCSYVLAWVAGAIAVAGTWAWTVVAVMTAQYVLAIRHEERQFLAGELGTAYARYRLSTGMLFPRVPRGALGLRRRGPGADLGISAPPCPQTD